MSDKFIKFFKQLILPFLFVTSILKFIGVMTWFMHLRWDKILNTILFLMGLVISVFTYIAVIYMADDPPVVEEFKVSPLEQVWKTGNVYNQGDYVKHNDNFFVAEHDHTSPDSFNKKVLIWGCNPATNGGAIASNASALPLATDKLVPNPVF